MSFRKYQVSNIKYQVRGFTLIELLIVVAIIAILVSVGAVAFTQATKQGRDSQRKANLQEVASALEQFYGDNNVYPETASGEIDCTSGSWGSAMTCDVNGNSITYLNELPSDPRPATQGNYYYQPTTVGGAACDNDVSTTTCQRFILGAKLENDRDVDYENPPCLVVGMSDNYTFCTTNP